MWLGMPALAAQEEDRRTVQSLRAAWYREGVLGQPGVQSKSLSENQKRS